MLFVHKKFPGTAGFLILLVAASRIASGATPAFSLEQAYSRSGTLQDTTLQLGGVRKAGLYSVLFSVASPAAFRQDGRGVGARHFSAGKCIKPHVGFDRPFRRKCLRHPEA